MLPINKMRFYELGESLKFTIIYRRHISCRSKLCSNVSILMSEASVSGLTATITRPLSIFLLCFCVAWKQLMINWEFPQYWYHHAHQHREGQILSTRAGNAHLNSGVIFIITWLIKSSSKYSKFWSFWKPLKHLCVFHIVSYLNVK